MSDDRPQARLVPQPRGGALKQGPNDGNGGGRPRNKFRNALLGSLVRNDKYWRDVLAGKNVILVPPLNPRDKPTYRYPTHEERERAREQCLRYGLGTKDEVVVLGSTEVFDAFADALGDHLDDVELIERIITAAENRLNGEDQ